MIHRQCLVLQCDGDPTDGVELVDVGLDPQPGRVARQADGTLRVSGVTSEAIGELADRVRPSTLKRLRKNAVKWRTRDSMNAVEKLSEVVDGRRRIVP